MQAVSVPGFLSFYMACDSASEAPVILAKGFNTLRRGIAVLTSHPHEAASNQRSIRTPLESISAASAEQGADNNEIKKMTKLWVYTFDPERNLVLKIEHLADDDIQTRRELSVAEYAGLAASLSLVAGPLIDPALISNADGKREEWVYSVDDLTGSISKIEKIGTDGQRTELAFDDYANLAAYCGIFSGPFASSFFFALANSYYQGYAEGQAAAYSLIGYGR